jgi:Carbamoyltransferase N-terminus
VASFRRRANQSPGAARGPYLSRRPITVSTTTRSLAAGKISCLFGGEETLLDPLRLDSLGFAYGFVTRALGFRMLRHEGKVTGLAAYGQPTLYEPMAEHFSVDAAGRVWCDWINFLELEAGINAIVEGAQREDAAASIQMLVEQVTLESLSRILRRVPHRRLGLAGGLYAVERPARIRYPDLVDAAERFLSAKAKHAVLSRFGEWLEPAHPLVAARPGEGRLTERTAGVQPVRREPVFMPHTRP